MNLSSNSIGFSFYGFSFVPFCNFKQSDNNKIYSHFILFGLVSLNMISFLLLFRVRSLASFFVCGIVVVQRRKEDREHRYTNVMRSLVWRYVSAMQRRYDDSAVTEDDINEVKADISAMRYEFLEVFERVLYSN